MTWSLDPIAVQLFVPSCKNLRVPSTGYCGADLKALCAEAALHALRRRYPQIYTTQDKLELDVSSIDVSAKDFHRATQAIVPTTQRSMTSPGRSLSLHIRPLLCRALSEVLALIRVVFPDALAQLSSVDTAGWSGDTGTQLPGRRWSVQRWWRKCSKHLWDCTQCAPVSSWATRSQRWLHSWTLAGDHHYTLSCKLPKLTRKLWHCAIFHLCSYAYQQPSTHRPRLLIAGDVGQGQTSHLGQQCYIILKSYRSMCWTCQGFMGAVPKLQKNLVLR